MFLLYSLRRTHLKKKLCKCVAHKVSWYITRVTIEFFPSFFHFLRLQKKQDYKCFYLSLHCYFYSHFFTGKSISEALIFASTNPQYDERLFMKIENFNLRTSGEHDVYINCFFVLTFRTTFVHNMFSWCCELLKKIYLYIIYFN